VVRESRLPLSAAKARTVKTRGSAPVVRVPVTPSALAATGVRCSATGRDVPVGDVTMMPIASPAGVRGVTGVGRLWLRGQG